LLLGCTLSQRRNARQGALQPAFLDLLRLPYTKSGSRGFACLASFLLSSRRGNLSLRERLGLRHLSERLARALVLTHGIMAVPQVLARLTLVRETRRVVCHGGRVWTGIWITVAGVQGLIRVSSVALKLQLLHLKRILAALITKRALARSASAELPVEPILYTLEPHHLLAQRTSLRAFPRVEACPVRTLPWLCEKGRAEPGAELPSAC